MTPPTNRERCEIPDTEDSAHVRALIDAVGIYGASARTGLSNTTLCRIAAGLPVYRRTLARLAVHMGAER